MRYKNLSFSFSLEIIIGLVTSILIISVGPGTIAFLAILAIRPLIPEREQISENDEYWYYSFQPAKSSLILISTAIISIYDNCICINK